MEPSHYFFFPILKKKKAIYWISHKVPLGFSITGKNLNELLGQPNINILKHLRSTPVHAYLLPWVGPLEFHLHIWLPQDCAEDTHIISPLHFVRRGQDGR